MSGCYLLRTGTNIRCVKYFYFCITYHNRLLERKVSYKEEREEEEDEGAEAESRIIDLS